MNNITLIVAMDASGAIGKDNTIPWKSKEDMKHFRETTTDHVVVMGRKTYESLNKKPLKDRINIVVTSDPGTHAAENDLFTFVDSIEKALQPRGDDKTIFLIGGSQTYEQGFKYCDKLIITVFSRTLVEEPDSMLPDNIFKYVLDGVRDKTNPLLLNSICKLEDEVIHEDPLEHDFKILRIDNKDVIPVPSVY